MKLFDTHFHYYGDPEPEEFYHQAEADGTFYLLAAGADYPETLKAKNFSAAVENSWFAAGVHPHSASDYLDGISMFDEFKNEPKLVAVGEIGLDYFYENSHKNDQIKVFEQFTKLALDWNQPAIIHCRDKNNCEEAYAETYRILTDFASSGGKFVVHCYTGTIEWAKKFLDMGAYIGITGIVTFPKAQNVRDVLKIIPENRLLLETDSPYLAPVPHRGKSNHPQYLIEVAKKVASEKNMPLEDLVELTTTNAFNFFKCQKPA
jgi:TatD DNase family protein